MEFADPTEQVKQLADLILFKVQCGEVQPTVDAMETFLLHLESHEPSFFRLQLNHLPH
jgi:hypothetical protein